MGYCYAISNGRRLLVCDCCGEARGTTRKRPCPHGWCQATAMCAACWKDPEKRGAWRAYHVTAECARWTAEADARERTRDYLLARGAYVRCSAINVGEGMVRVTFRDKHGATAERDVTKATYDAVPILRPATMPDFGVAF